MYTLNFQKEVILMFVKIRGDGMTIVKSSLTVEPVFPEWSDLEVVENDLEYVVSGKPSILYKLIVWFCKDFDVELM